MLIEGAKNRKVRVLTIADGTWEDMDPRTGLGEKESMRNWVLYILSILNPPENPYSNPLFFAENVEETLKMCYVPPSGGDTSDGDYQSAISRAVRDLMLHCNNGNSEEWMRTLVESCFQFHTEWLIRQLTTNAVEFWNRQS